MGLVMPCPNLLENESNGELILPGTPPDFPKDIYLTVSLPTDEISASASNFRFHELLFYITSLFA